MIYYKLVEFIYTVGKKSLINPKCNNNSNSSNKTASQPTISYKEKYDWRK